MDKILGFKPISDGIRKLRVKGKFYRMTLINIYASTEDKRKSKSNFMSNYRELRIEY
jgi:hypothetical protein